MTIENRVDALERKLKRTERLNYYLLGTVILVVAFGILGAASSNTEKLVRANAFMVEDEKGNARAMLGMSKDGPFLALRDENEKTCFALTFFEKQPNLSMLSGDHKLRVTLGIFDDKSSLVFYDKNGKTAWSAP